MNLTDNEIIKKFKEFIEYSRYNVGRKSTELLENILALIECKDVAIEVFKKDIDYQKADIDFYKERSSKYEAQVAVLLEQTHRQRAEIERLLQKMQQLQGETIKEFAELIKKAFPSIAGAVDYMVKERVGDLNGQKEKSTHHIETI